MSERIRIKNKKARYSYHIMDTFTAGIRLQGTEIKSIREGKASLNESFCYFVKGELFVKMHISEYERGTIYNHDPRRERKLLLTKRELKKLKTRVQERGLTIIPLTLFINDEGLAKLDIALAKGKKLFDKRDSIKEKDMKRDMDRRIS